ncbi:protein SCO1 homolog 2, mitochondrial [Momordica charantia]|uniref:Protein SCO1 homolog 2, mitochondrial n=1 Tax=Momordica charantia TaxID=3673 RepID=A0A6J1BW99_MOMCH|nr:protein SCO1 homolog 2, mitochondrial [Momordica charantia]
MPIFNSIFFSSKHHFRQARGLLQRFHPSNSVRSCKYSKSSKYNKEIPEVHPLISIDEQASRSRATYVIPAAVMSFVGLAALVHYNDERRAVLKGQGNSSDGNLVRGPIIGGPFTLTDTENRVVTEQNLRGNWSLLYFGYTSSPDVVPEQLQIMSKAIDILESRHNLKVLPVFVTIDPQRDNPSHLRAYLKEFDPRIVGLAGPVAAVRQMAQEYRVYFKKVEEEGGDYLIESSHKMYLLSPNLEVMRCCGIEYNAEELSQAILNVVQKTPQ